MSRAKGEVAFQSWGKRGEPSSSTTALASAPRPQPQMTCQHELDWDAERRPAFVGLDLTIYAERRTNSMRAAEMISGLGAKAIAQSSEACAEGWRRQRGEGSVPSWVQEKVEFASPLLLFAVARRAFHSSSVSWSAKSIVLLIRIPKLLDCTRFHLRMHA